MMAVLIHAMLPLLLQKLLLLLTILGQLYLVLPMFILYLLLSVKEGIQISVGVQEKKIQTVQNMDFAVMMAVLIHAIHGWKLLQQLPLILLQLLLTLHPLLSA